MITSVRIENFKTFNKPVELSLLANNRSKRFFTNYNAINHYNVLKSIGIYGKNNVGKTCVIDAVYAIRNVLLGINTEVFSNIFENNTVSSLGVSFIVDGVGYDFDFKFDTKTREFIYEKYSCFDTKSNGKKQVLILRDARNNSYDCKDKNFIPILKMLSNNNILLYTANTSSFPDIEKIKNIFREFARKIYVINMNNIPLTNTIEIMKKNTEEAQEVAKFLKEADLEIDGFEFKNDALVTPGVPQEQILLLQQQLDPFKLITYHKDKAVPFLLFDSTGTKKIAAIASYVIKTIKEGGVLLVDELDSSLHFKLSRAIVAMFNNMDNEKGQLIFTTHDVSLMDCKTLLRKEQIWFADKDAEQTYLYSLSDFKARDGVREDVSNIANSYQNGAFASLPEPDLVSCILGANDNE